MLTLTNFTEEDRIRIEKSKGGYKVYLLFYLILLVPASFLFGLLGLTKKGYGYWLTTSGFLVLFFMIALYLIIRDLIEKRKDLKHQLKYRGTLNILKKSKSKNVYCIYTNSKDFKKLNVLSADVFAKIRIGDELYIEITKHGKQILRLRKGSLELINSG